MTDTIPQTNSPQIAPNEKYCIRCKQSFPATSEYFPRGSGRKGGLRPTCQTCITLQNKKTRQKRRIGASLDERNQRIDLACDSVKLCAKCKVLQPLTNFHVFTHNNKYNSWCKSCSSNQSREQYQRDKIDNPKKLKNKYLKFYYGITLDEYNEMYKKQNGVCAACGHPETSSKANMLLPLSVDHCHTYSVVRGLLCNGCNVALGLLKEDAERIKGLLRYIENYRDEMNQLI
jgi:hypothetical protein